MKKATGKVIRAFRKHLGYTHEFVANEINVTTSTLSNIENGRVCIDMDKFHRIAKVFKIRDGIILDLAVEVFEANDDSWLTNSVRQIRPIYNEDDIF